MTIAGHFTTGFKTAAAWAPTTVYAPFTFIQPNPANGYLYLGGGGTSGSVQPTWPTAIGANVGPDGSVAVWSCIATLIGFDLGTWDQMQSQTVNGDLGGTWSPTTPITFLTGNGGVVLVQGPTQVTNNGELLAATGATVSLAAGDYPRNGTDHLGRYRRIVTACELGVSDSLIGVRPDFAISALTAVACAIAYYAAAADDSSVTVSTVPVQWTLPLDVHNTSTFVDVVLTYRANLGTPKARVIAVAPNGAVAALTSAANGADANGFVPPPAVVSTETVQSWTIPIDGGASPSNAVISRDGYTYLLHVVEDQTVTDYPSVLPVLSPVVAATTGPIDMAKAPTTIDGVVVPTNGRVLVKNQYQPEENGVYLYPGAGNPFAIATATPVPYWLSSNAYSSGDLVQPLGFVGGHGLFFKCTTGGTSSGHQPTWPLATGATVADNTVVWTCQGPLDPYTYSPAVELRTYGLLQGATVQVMQGTVNGDTVWQYTGATIEPTDLGSTPAVGWVTVPTGLVGSTTSDVPQEGVGVFAAQGNAYHQAACDFANIITQAFQ